MWSDRPELPDCHETDKDKVYDILSRIRYKVSVFCEMWIREQMAGTNQTAG